MRPFKLAIYTRYARHHNALRLVVNEYVNACVKLYGDDVALIVTRDQATSFSTARNVFVLPFDSSNALLSHATTLLLLPLLSVAFPRTHVLIPQIAFVGPIRGGFTAVVHDVIEWRVRSQTFAKLLARRVLYRITFLFARRILCVSAATRRELLDFFPAYANKCGVVHNGVDALARVNPKPVAELAGVEFAAVVGYVSEPQKNLLRVIDAMSELPSTNSRYADLRLVFAGPLGLRAHEVLEAGKRRLGDRFMYLGVIDDAHVRWLFEHCAVAIAASKAEGFSLTPAQALFHGGRVAASDIAPHREILANNAKYFNPLDTEDCARAIIESLGANTGARNTVLPTWGDLPGRLQHAMNG